MVMLLFVIFCCIRRNCYVLLNMLAIFKTAITRDVTYENSELFYYSEMGLIQVLDQSITLGLQLIGSYTIRLFVLSGLLVLFLERLVFST